MKKSHLKLKRKFLEYYAKLPIQRLAAESIGRNEDSIILWKKKDSGFSDLMNKTKAEWALSKSNQVKSVEWLLERVMKDHFAERKEVEIGVEGRLEEALDRIAKILPASK